MREWGRVGSLPPSAAAYAAALGALALTTGWRALLDPWVGDRLLLYHTVPAIVVAVWLGGAGPGALVAVCGYVISNLLFIAPRHELTWSGAAVTGLVGYVPASAAIVLFGQAMHRARACAEEAGRRLQAHARLLDLGHAFARDPAGRIVWWSSGAESLYGWRADEAVGRMANDLLRTRGGRPVADIVAETLRIDEWAGELFQTRRDGSAIRVASHWAVRRDVAGRPELILEVNNDLTQLDTTRAALAASEARFVSLADALPGFLFLLRPDGACQYLNPQFYEFTGMAPGSAEGFAFYAAVHPDDAREVAEAATAAREAGTPLQLRCRLRRHDGTYRWFLAQMHAIRDAAGSVVQWVGTATDVQRLTESEEAVRVAEARLQLALESGELGTWEWDLGSGALAWSPEHERLFGLAPGTFAGHIDALYERIHADDLAAVRHVLATAPDRGEPFQLRFRIRLPDGTLRWIALRGKAHVEAGVVRRLAGVALDVTAVETPTLALKESEARFRLLANHTPAPIWILDEQRNATFVNEPYSRFLGVPEDQAAALDWSHWLHPDDAPSYMEDFAGATAARRAFRGVARFRRHDGVYRWLDSVAVPRFAADGRFLGYAGCSLDITERIETEQELLRRTAELEDSNRRLQLAQRAGRAGVFDWWVDEDRVTWTAGTAALYGIPIDAFAGTFDDFARRVLPGDRRRIEDQLRAVFDARGPELEYEFRVDLPEGTQRWLRGHLVVDYADGRPVRVTGITIDIDELKRALEALQEADRRKDEFLAMLAHELRNPLAPIRNAVRVLEVLGPDDDRLAAARNIILRQAEHMTRLVDDLLDVSRITRGLIPLRRERVRLTEVVDDAVDAGRPLLEQLEHTLSVGVAPEPLELDGDRARLTQVLGNLLTNAAKFTPRGGHVTLTTEARPEGAVIRVRDTGVGIPREQQQRIFDLFVQEDAPLARSHGGLGIGLTLVKRIVELHGGRVEVQSEGHGRGAEFVVTLPARVSAVPHPAPERIERSPRDRLRILLVEDNRDAAESFRMLLELGGHEVRVAHDGLAALRIVVEFQPHLAFMDIGLPEIDGYELARRLRGQPGAARTRLVALTGYGRPDDMERAREAGFDHHLTKPADPGAVETLLAEHGAAHIAPGSRVVH